MAVKAGYRVLADMGEMRANFSQSTLYVHFEEKPGSTHSEMRDDGVILDYKGRRLVGVTILEASQR